MINFRKLTSALISVIFLLLLVFTACRSFPLYPEQSNALNIKNKGPQPTYREMVTVPGKIIKGSGKDGVFIEGRTVTLSSFKIAKYQTTWELWNEVYTWSVPNGYNFPALNGLAWQGHEAVNVNPGTGTSNPNFGWNPEQKKVRPVTFINWRDIVVWCNAYSEMSGLQPVYIDDNGNTIKDSSIRVEVFTFQDISRNGYRLPTEAEWEFAARGGNPDRKMVWNFTWPGSMNFAQVAWGRGTPASVTGGSNFGANPVGTKLPNTLDLYDMAGNIAELVWDSANEVVPGEVKDPIEPGGEQLTDNRVRRGGGFITPPDWSTVSYRNEPFGINGRNQYVGFRVAAKAE